MTKEPTDKVIQLEGNLYPNSGNPQAGRVYDPDGIAPTLGTMQGGNTEPKIIEPISCAMRGRGKPTQQQLEIGGSVANAVTTVQKDSMVVEPLIVGYSRDEKGKIVGRHLKSIANTVTTFTGSGCHTDQYVAESLPHEDLFRIRKLTEREVFRLMDVDETDIDKILQAKDAKGKRIISKSQCYKMAGNSIVVSCLDGIFESLFFPPESDTPRQPSLFDL